MSDHPDLDTALELVAKAVEGPGSVGPSLLRITDLAVETVAEVDFASITARHSSGRLETLAPSSPLLYVADGLQYELNEGPCYDAVTDESVVYSADLTHDERWPVFGPRAGMLGLASLLAVRLCHPGSAYLSLNLYSDTVGAFATHREVARLFIAELSEGFDPAEQGQLLREDLASRTMVELATGILMHRHGVDAEEAVMLLSQLSRQRRDEG